MRILIADDNESNAVLLEQILTGAGYRDVHMTRDAEDVPLVCMAQPRPDLLMLDLHMPGLSGYDILAMLRPILLGEPFMPVLVVTADITPEAKRRALSLGASDFVTKPVDATELLLRTSHLLRAGEMRRELKELVATRTEELDRAREEVLERLALAAECRDDMTGEHILRVARTAKLLARQLGLPAGLETMIEATAPLHDIGKIAIPDGVLLKPGPLTGDEIEVMRQHVEIGARILAGSECPRLELAREIALYHHERWDGSGYLHGLAGPQIPLAARITAVADVFDALTHARPYKSAWPVDRAVSEILHGSGSQFDPDVVEAFAGLDHPYLVDPPLTGGSALRTAAITSSPGSDSVVSPLSAVTEAARTDACTAAISPNESPASSSPMSRPSRFTRALPLTTT
jgi:putative two-component system response regulator